MHRESSSGDEKWTIALQGPAGDVEDGVRLPQVPAEAPHEEEQHGVHSHRRVGGHTLEVHEIISSQGIKHTATQPHRHSVVSNTHTTAAMGDGGTYSVYVCVCACTPPPC